MEVVSVRTPSLVQILSYQVRNWEVISSSPTLDTRQLNDHLDHLHSPSHRRQAITNHLQNLAKRTAGTCPGTHQESIVTQKPTGISSVKLSLQFSLICVAILTRNTIANLRKWGLIDVVAVFHLSLIIASKATI